MNRRQFLRRSVTAAAIGLPQTSVLARSRPLRSLADSLDGHLIARGSIEFDAERLVHNRAIDARPKAIVQCASTDDVRRCVEHAVNNGIRIAVRCGGHSPAGHSTVDDGLVIDLSLLMRTEANPSRRTITAGGGCRGRMVVAESQRYGLDTPMGGCGDVGIGGLTLGGGGTGISGRYGAVCDNVVSARVVTADGNHATASPESNPDLFWGIRGGGGNFGIVTEFEYQLHDVGDLHSGVMTFPISDARDVLLRYRGLVATAPIELQSYIGLGSFGGDPGFNLLLVHCGDEADGTRLIDNWQSALQPASASFRSRPQTPSVIEPALPRYSNSVFFHELSDNAVDIIARFASAAPAGASAISGRRHGKAAFPDHDNAFPLRGEGYTLPIAVSHERLDARAKRWVDDFRAEMAPYEAGGYVNSMTMDSVAWVKRAYGAKYDRLAALKQTWDPANVFNRNHNVLPADGKQIGAA